MSYQPPPPGGQPVPPPFSAPPSFSPPPPVTPFPAATGPAPDGAAAKGSRRAGVLGVGGLVVAVGVVGGVAVMMAGSSNYDDGVANLARAPLGCTTTLEFSQTGTFTVYVETVGSIGARRGDCDGVDDSYEYRGDGTPRADVVVTNADGDEIELHRDHSRSYDTGGFTGASMSTFTVDATGEYTVVASSDDEGFAIAIGRDPKSSADATKSKGLALLIGGLVIGGVLVLLGLRRTKPGSGAGPNASAPPPQQWPAPPGT